MQVFETNPAAIRPQTGFNALIADDHSLFRAGLSYLLRDEFEFAAVTQTASLDEAIAVLDQRHDIRLALFDLSMPGMSGPTCLAKVRAAHPGLKIVVVSASEEKDHVLATIASGLNGFIPKSLPDTEIVKALRIILNGNIFVPSLMTDSSSDLHHDPKTAELCFSATARSRQPKDASDVTARQRDVLECVRRGLTNKEIARKLDIAENTVKIHVATLLSTFNVRNRTELAMHQ